jgi:CheY-like chemotaxis protein
MDERSVAANIRPRRVLVVEDEALIALFITDQLADLGHIVVGPAFSFPEAVRLASTATIDLALLDLNLRGVFAGEVADLLTRRRIPFVFMTGYYAPDPDFRFANIEVLEKPFKASDLQRAIARTLQVCDAKPTKPNSVIVFQGSSSAAK